MISYVILKYAPYDWLKYRGMAILICRKKKLRTACIISIWGAQRSRDAWSVCSPRLVACLSSILYQGYRQDPAVQEISLDTLCPGSTVIIWGSRAYFCHPHIAGDIKAWRQIFRLVFPRPCRAVPCRSEFGFLRTQYGPVKCSLSAHLKILAPPKYPLLNQP